MSSSLNPDKALIFRITHRDNVPWILDHGMRCKSSPTQAPHFRTIGNPDLIEKRQHRSVPLPPGGTLSDYVPFYFTPFSPMMYNIKSGYGGIARVPNEEIVIFVSSLRALADHGRPFVFTDRHAYLVNARFFDDLNALVNLDWGILQRRDFKRDADDPEKVERYQAEALVHQSVPVEALLGAICYNETMKSTLDQMVVERALTLSVHARPGWYF